MKIKFAICFISIVLILNKANCQEIDNALFIKLEAQFQMRNIELDNAIIRIEEYCIDNKMIVDDSWNSKIKYLEIVLKTDSIPRQNISDSLYSRLKFDLPLQPLSEITHDFKMSEDSIRFGSSKFNRILQQIESSELKDRGNPSLIAKALLDNLNAEDFQKPFYKAVFFMIIANFYNIHYRSLDFMLIGEKDYAQHFGTSDFDWPLIESRNYCDLYVDQMGVVKLNGERLIRPSHLSDQLKEYYLKNRSLSKEEARMAIADPQYKGYNYPFYSYVTLLELDQKIMEVIKEYEDLLALKSTDSVKLRDVFNDIFAWQRKKQFLLIYKKEQLIEIHYLANLRVIIEKNADISLLNKLGNEIVQAFSELRDMESIKTFDESYNEILVRHNFLLNDFAKLGLLENLFPMRTFINPPYINDPPPPSMEIIEK